MSSSEVFRFLSTQPPELVYFDHLYSEYQTIKSEIPETVNARLDETITKKKDGSLRWNDLYSFELTLSSFLPVDSLRSRILRLRADYRSIAGQTEYDEYMASKSPELINPPDPMNPPDLKTVDYVELLREDLRDLLGRIYLRYAILPVREAKLKRLTQWAGILCGVFLLVLLILVVYIVIDKGTLQVPALALFVVLSAGALGGFVSAIQRIQTTMGGSDSVYSLSLLFNGSYAVFVAPLTGSIFAVLLYLMFTGNILVGRFFPVIFTPPAAVAAHASPSNTAAAPNSVVEKPSEGSPADTSTGAPANDAASTKSSERSSSDSGDNSKTSGVNSPPPKPSASAGLGIKDFLSMSGPASGQDYALLIIWCFIAGFAERFVPDALDRLIAGKGNQGSAPS